MGFNMDSFFLSGLDFIRSVQTTASPLFTVIMLIISFIGWEFMLLMILILFWCINEKKGLRLGFALLISLWINITLKYFFDQPRPFFEGYDPSVGMINVSMGGLPSGHAQNSLVVLFIIASWLKNKWAYSCAAFLCLLIGFSRIYLGVHFPVDIAAGWVIGGIIVSGYFILNNRIEELIAKGGFRAGMISSAALSFVMIIYLPGMELLVPAGMILGIGTGYCLNRKYIGFASSALLERQGIYKFLPFFVRLLLGIAGFLLIFTRGKNLLPQDSLNINLYSFILTALCGFWISAAAPWVFIKLRLAQAQPLVVNLEQKKNV
jgi:membrane-associated phospholipid phosphatase